LIRPASIVLPRRELPDESPKQRCSHQSATEGYFVYSDVAATHIAEVSVSSLQTLYRESYPMRRSYAPPEFLHSSSSVLRPCSHSMPLPIFLTGILMAAFDTYICSSTLSGLSTTCLTVTTFVTFAGSTTVCGLQSPHQGRTQHLGRCHQPGLRQPQWESMLPELLVCATPLLAAHSDAQLGVHVAHVVHGHLADSSRRTFGIGWRRFTNFCIPFLSRIPSSAAP